MSDQEVLDLDIITALGVAHLPDDEKKVIKQKILFLVEKSVELRLLQMLSPSDVPKLEEIVHEKGEESEDILSYLQAIFPQAGDMYREELIATKRNLLVSVPQ